MTINGVGVTLPAIPSDIALLVDSDTFHITLFIEAVVFLLVEIPTRGFHPVQPCVTVLTRTCCGKQKLARLLALNACAKVDTVARDLGIKC